MPQFMLDLILLDLSGRAMRCMTQAAIAMSRLLGVHQGQDIMSLYIFACLYGLWSLWSLELEATETVHLIACEFAHANGATPASIVARSVTGKRPCDKIVDDASDTRPVALVCNETHHQCNTS